MNFEREYVVEKLVDLVKIPSPSGFTEKAIEYIGKELLRMGFEPQYTNKGACYVCVGGEESPVTFAAHVDTLGAMVKSLKPNGRLEITPIGGYMMNSVEGENCEIHTKNGKVYTGTIQTVAPSVHVFENARKIERKPANMEVRLDEIVKTREDLEKLGIEAGDFISFDPRVVVTKSGFIKTRHLDDKASVAVLLAVAKDVSEGKLKLSRKTYLFFSNYEEVGHGASSGIPADSTEIISVDMGAVGDTLGTDEYVVSICAKDSGGPYDSRLVKKLIKKAKEAGVDYSVDIYPFYGSDVEASLRAGYDVVFGLIGPGVEASHGYERTHYKGLENTIKLIESYLKG